MNRLDELIKDMCPNGIEYRRLWEVTVWDKKFNAVDKNKQQKVYKYPYLLAKDLFSLEVDNGTVRLLSTGEYVGWTSEEVAGDNLCEGEVVTIPWGKSKNVKDLIKYYKGKFVTADNRIATSIDTQILLNKFLYYFMVNSSGLIDSFYRGSGIKHPSMKDVLDMTIPLPPLPVQHEIVRILDIFTKLTAELTAELTARKQQYEYYRDDLFNKVKKDNISWIMLGKIAKNLDAKRKPVTKNKRESGIYPYYGASGIVDYVKDYIFDGEYLLVSEDGANLVARNTPIAFSISGKNWVNNHAHVLEFDSDITRIYVEIYLNSINLSPYISTAAQPKLTQENLSKILIPLPDYKTQEKIVTILTRFDKLCNDISEGLPAEIEARQKQYEYYRDKLLTFNEMTIAEQLIAATKEEVK